MYVDVLPGSGFEWNINDTVLSVSPLSSYLGVLELLVTFTIGARLVLFGGSVSNGLQVDKFVGMVNEHGVSACIMPSHLIVQMAKLRHVRLDSLAKIIYIGQQIHPSLVALFKTKYRIHNCRFALCKHFHSRGFASLI